MFTSCVHTWRPVPPASCKVRKNQILAFAFVNSQLIYAPIYTIFNRSFGKDYMRIDEACDFTLRVEEA